MVFPFMDLFGRLPRPLRYVAVTGAVAVLLYLSLAPTRDLIAVDLIWDKAEHATSYLVLMLVGRVFAPRRLLAFTAFAFGLGVAIEFLQAALPFGRDGDWRDVVANSTGIAVGFLVWRLTVRRTRA